MTDDYTTLQAIWFLLICVLWVGYFVLEGFDFGVGMLLRKLGRDNAERRAIVHSIGPVWDGNEVWLLTAGGATFAAFPEWYATLFSGFYLPLFLVLFALIIRGVAFEFWGKHDTARWRGTWEWAIILGSFLPALLWGVAWADIIRGVPIDANAEYTGGFFNLLTPYALLGGVVTLLVFLSHGAIFLTLRLKGELLDRARGIAQAVAPLAAVVTLGFLAWTIGRQSDREGIEVVSLLLAIGAVALLAAAPAFIARRPGVAFGISAGAIALFFSALFVDLFPDVMISSTAAANNMSLAESASTQYTLKVMTVVAVIMVPVVLAYQAWTYWVFRARVGREDFEGIKTPVDLLAKKTGGPGGPATITRSVQVDPPGGPDPRK